MRLYDRLLEMPGGLDDTLMQGGISKFVKELRQAQCFQMSEDIAFTCSDVLRTRPSTLLGALDLIRAPYPHTWVEWTPSQREGNRDNYNMFEHPKPTPKRVGALITANNACTRGYMLLAWNHQDDSIMVCPLGVIFDWDKNSTEPVVSQYVKAIYGPETTWLKGVIDRKIASFRGDMPDKWQKFSNDPKERDASTALLMRGEIIPLEMFIPFLSTFNIKPGSDWYESFCDDLAGELPFVEAFFLLLNSRNTIIRQERDDFAKLNKARAKNHKAPLREFINTRLRMSKVQGNRLMAKGMTREQARMHLCRGHFKVRRSGVFWWSPHTRGGRLGAVVRRQYEVSA